jgi:uncharacterized protein YlxW (UPF0749 family)
MSDGPPQDAAEPAAEQPAARTSRWPVRLLRPRLRRVDVLVALLLAVLGFAAAVQVRTTQTEGPLAYARQEDLVTILDDLSNRNERLRTEIGSLTDAQRRLTTGSNQSEAALAEARRRAQLLGVLAGTVPAGGPGITLTITDPQRQVTAEVLLDALMELRDAGAEAVQLEGAGAAAVRVVASTHFVDRRGEGVLVDGSLLRSPYRFVVVGEPETMARALGIPGGVIATVQGRAATAVVEREDALVVDALQSVEPPRYARPAPEGD